MNIYKKISKDSDKWLSNNELETKLREGFLGFSTGPQPNRTRSKLYNQKICDILGFSIPQSFKRTKPKFPILDFDVYIQQSNNLQIWNESIPFNRRYVVIRVDENGSFINLRVISGKELSAYDTTGTITTKLQAILDIKNIKNTLYNDRDTNSLLSHLASQTDILFENIKPSDNPKSGYILSIKEIYARLLPLIGYSFPDTKSDRQRGDFVHKLCSEKLGYTSFSDDGQFPDIRNQLVEIKTQTSPTIDIGCENPTDIIKKTMEYDLDISNEDIRYVIIYAEILQEQVIIKNIIIVSGKYFFNIFTKMEGNGTNGKKQLPLPKNFFD